MCKIEVDGKKVVMDCATCPFELSSKECIKSFLSLLGGIRTEVQRARFEEEVVVELDSAEIAIMVEYAKIVNEFEMLFLDDRTYGSRDDDYFPKRKNVFINAFKNMIEDPLNGVRMMEEYAEPPAMRSLYIEGRDNFFKIRNNLVKKIRNSAFFRLIEKAKSTRKAFAALLKLRTSDFVDALLLSLPLDAIEVPNSHYSLDHGISVKIYDLQKSEARLYVQTDPLDSLREELKQLLREELNKAYSDGIPRESSLVEILYETKINEYRQNFLRDSKSKGIDLDYNLATLMAREVVNWAFGLGTPIENISLDRRNITDIYVDAENSPIYLEHVKYGICHTLFRYNRKLMEHSIRDIVLTSKQRRKFDEKNPILDVVLTRLNMRCHLQGPPATFGELQMALRLMKETPFTYSQYLYFKSFSPFFAGYDDLMVGLGTSEAVLGLKGVGKTAFTSAKILAIGSAKRILPIQDIEEIPVKAYRKRGFHIGAMRVQSSDVEMESGTELSLIAMANASLRMGDSCLIINELRSRVAIQGLMNLLNTQPGVFVLYNLHAENLKAVQDRFELVFGIPAAAMFATDRYTFLKKVTYGKKSGIYRMLGESFESDLTNRTFANIFQFERNYSPETSKSNCLFLKNPEASSWNLDIPIAPLEKSLDINFIPPALARRCEEKGIPVEQAVLQAFFKGKVYDQIYKSAMKNERMDFLEIDFVIKINTELNKLMREMENERGGLDYRELDRIWEGKFKELLRSELSSEPTREEGKEIIVNRSTGENQENGGNDAPGKDDVVIQAKPNPNANSFYDSIWKRDSEEK